MTRPMLKIVRGAFAAAGALLFMPGCVPHSTGPTEVGVRTVKFSLSGKKGVEEKVYAPGSTYFFVPIVSDWNVFDTRLHTLDMTAQTRRGDRSGQDELVFKTIDGNDINLDVVISYRIDPAKAPMILQNIAANDEELRENIVRTVCRSMPRDIFGELNTEKFYSAEERSAKAEAVKGKLNEMLNPYGVIVERVGTGDYSFNPEYQKAIEDRMVADQRTERFKSATRAAEQEYLRKIEEAKGDVGKMKAEADGEFERAKIEADAAYAQQQRVAEAVQAEGQAEAEAIQTMNKALTGSGGEAVVKLQIAESMKGKRVILLPMGNGLDVRSTNVNDLLQFYGLSKLGAAPPAK